MIPNHTNCQSQPRKFNSTDLPHFIKCPDNLNHTHSQQQQPQSKIIQDQLPYQKTLSNTDKLSQKNYTKRSFKMQKQSLKLSQKNPDGSTGQQTSPKRTNFIMAHLLKNRIRAASHKKTFQKQTYQIRNQKSNNSHKSIRKTRSLNSKILRLNHRRDSSNKSKSYKSLENAEQNTNIIYQQPLKTVKDDQLIPDQIREVNETKVESKNLNQKFSNELRLNSYNQNERYSINLKQSILNLNVPVKGKKELIKYEMQDEQKAGGYGIVKLGRKKQTKQRVAIKIYEKKKITQQNVINHLQREINLLGELNHPSIVKLVEVISNRTKIFIVLQYGGNNSLYDYMMAKSQCRIKEPEAKRFFLEISEALLYLHERDIVHRDIKLQNILINRQKKLRLIDFGFSLKSAKDKMIDTFCGTPPYMAPQIVSKSDHIPIYTDIWSMGVLYYGMLQGNYPFTGKNQKDLFEKIKKGKFTYKHNDISERSKKLIESLLQVDPLKRPTIHQVLSEQNREWLLGLSHSELKIESL